MYFYFFIYISLSGKIMPGTFFDHKSLKNKDKSTAKPLARYARYFLAVFCGKVAGDVKHAHESDGADLVVCYATGHLNNRIFESVKHDASKATIIMQINNDFR